MTLYDRLADLPLRIESSDRHRRERETSSGFTRVTTTVALSGDGETGRGEDVIYAVEDHDALAEIDNFAFAGEYTLDSFSDLLDDVPLFPTKDPERRDYHHYRRWAVESAALDLALRQNDTDLGAELARGYDPVHFVASTSLDEGDPQRVHDLLDVNPELEFKLDPTSEWTEETIDSLAATDAVRVLDCKAKYTDPEVRTAPDPVLYRRILSNFPDAVIEDPGFIPSTRPLFEGEEQRVSWDVPITGVESIASLPFEPSWLNIKPSRFGTIESLLDTIEYCNANDITMYGGGQFELGVGREQIQVLASLFYPDSPNDVAPGEYNDPEIPDKLPVSPLAEPEVRGFRHAE